MTLKKLGKLSVNHFYNLSVLKVHGFVSISGFTSPVTNNLCNVGESLNLSLVILFT